MADYNELPFETEPLEHLATNGWPYSENSRCVLMTAAATGQIDITTGAA